LSSTGLAEKNCSSVDETSIYALESLGIEGTVVVGIDPETWDSNAMIQKYSSIDASLKVVNHVAERAVALMNHCNGAKRSRDEIELQSVLQVTENHGKKLKTMFLIRRFKVFLI
jgi:hypothetical protein